ncbi:MAG: hypothetical protein M3464_11455 [Chloroflexota bacterium]|nr:hypothetical protein [Chloroflexota bacterium]
MDGRSIRSPLLPGGDLVAAVLDRVVMSLADRGGASNMVGARWADVAAAHAMTWPGQERPNPGAPDSPLLVRRVTRLDDVPRIAAAASRRGLQNPDLLLFGMCDGTPTMQAADAKFSIETARAKQVSPSVIEGLLGLGEQFGDFLHHAGDAPAFIPGVFLSPDYPLTLLMLERRQGILRTTVRRSEVVLVPVQAAGFFGPMEGAGTMRLLAAVDRLPVSVDESLLAGLYYMRLARAAIGCWLDAIKPLLVFQDQPAVAEPAVEHEARDRAREATSAFDLIQRWNADVDTIRLQRQAVDQVATLPVANKDLRDQIGQLARARGQEPPSVNQVRRRLGAWYRGELRDQIGPLLPPVTDLPASLRDITRVGRTITPRLDTELARIVEQLGTQSVTTNEREPVSRQ